MLYQHFAPVDSAAKTSLTTVQEVDAVVLSVETNHVTPQHTLKHLVRPGKDPHDVPGREGDVEEETHPDIYLLLHTDVSDGVRSEHQVVVVEPDNWSFTDVTLIVDILIKTSNRHLDILLYFLMAPSVSRAKDLLTREYEFQVSILKTALSGIEWKSGQNVALQQPL